MLKILPTAALFGTQHLRVREGAVMTISHGFRSQIGWLPLSVKNKRSQLEDLALGIDKQQRLHVRT